jgi:hypothetical protein
MRVFKRMSDNSTVHLKYDPEVHVRLMLNT